MKKKTYLLLFIIIYANLNIFSQISQGGIPPSFKYNIKADHIDLVSIPMPDITQINYEDSKNDKNKGQYRVAVMLDVDLNMNNSGTWTDLPCGGRIWRLRIYSKGALGLNLVYNNFFIPKGSKLFLYNYNKKQIIGAFTDFNNSEDGWFATEIIEGEYTTLEYYEPALENNYSLKLHKENEKGHIINNMQEAKIEIVQIGYNYRGIEFLINKYRDSKAQFGASAWCHINVNCSPEGDNWQNQKRGVVLSLSSGYYCSGSLVNNTAEDFTPYYLTADHCLYPNPSIAIFYFNFEAQACTNPPSSPSYQTMTGASIRASGPVSGGSDFKLLELSNIIPANYNPYFNGWDISGSPATTGVGIHHPQGDIKKISTFTSQLVSTTWFGGGQYGITGGAWRVVWVETPNGHGVTEAGSSGSPLFDQNGKIVGTLSGGFSYCHSPSAHDLYGKIDFHWDRNGTADNRRLKPWLDPINSGATNLSGIDYSDVLIAQFSGNPTNIKVGESVSYTCSSIGEINSRTWSFPGGTPSYSTDKNPVITYNQAGVYNVSLTISDGENEHTETKEDYINVVDGLYSFVMDFEDCEDFSTDFSPWKAVDLNGSNTYAFSGINYPGRGEPMAFMAFNSFQTTPPVSGDNMAQQGVRFGASFANIDPPNNAWLISNKLPLGSGSVLSLWVKSFTDQFGLERYRIGVSTTDDEPSSFSFISSGSYETAPTTWTKKTYSLADYDNQDVYVAINCISDDAFVFMIDDIQINTIITDKAEVNLPENINIFPNPANSIITITNAKNSKIEIINILGEIVKTVNNASSKQIIDISDFSSGTYFVKINSEVYKINIVK